MAVLRLSAVTLFPEMFAALTGSGVTGRAFARGLAELTFANPRDFVAGTSRTVDDAPYGGGAGMVLKPEPVAAAIDCARTRLPLAKVTFLSPQGQMLSDALARELADEDEHILLCGRYLGIDQRVLDSRIDRELSVGAYVASGGELPAMLLCDVLMRYRAGVLGNSASAQTDSFAADLLAPPCYTRPPVFEGRKVPSVLLGGDHSLVAKWRAERAVGATRRRFGAAFLKNTPGR